MKDLLINKPTFNVLEFKRGIPVYYSKNGHYKVGYGLVESCDPLKLTLIKVSGEGPIEDTPYISFSVNEIAAGHFTLTICSIDEIRRLERELEPLQSKESLTGCADIQRAIASDLKF